MVLKFLAFFVLTLSYGFCAESSKYKKLFEINELLGKPEKIIEHLKQGEVLIMELEESEDEAVEEQIEIFESHKDNYENSIFKSSYFLQASYLTWNTPLLIERTGKSNIALFSEEKGPCFGLGLEYSNSKNGFNTSVCYAFINATISEDLDTGITFNQNDVIVNAVVMQNNYVYKIESDLRFKIGVPVIHRQGEYGQIIDGKVVDKKNLFFGYSLGSSWIFDQYLLDINLGAIDSFNSSFWIISIQYNL